MGEQFISRARPLRILITNLCLDNRSGTESVVRDLVTNFARRGHSPTLYAPVLGAPAEELRARGGRVIDSLEQMTAAPDVIHGHHNIPTVEAIATFPNCPAVFVSHDWRWWYDRPPRFERIYRYIAVDDTRRDYLLTAVGIMPGRVDVLHNAVDLARIPPRPTPLPDRPRRALAFTKTSAQLPALGEACAQFGMTLAALGRGSGNVTAEPEARLVEHDLVFATGRSAIEALCAGAAVIVGDARGLAGMVTRANCEMLRNLNFGSGAFTRQFTVEAVAMEIARYDRADALAVVAKIRMDADLKGLLERLECLYEEAISARRSVPVWSRHDRRALRQFIDDWPARGEVAEASWEPNRKRLVALSHGIDRRGWFHASLERIRRAIRHW
jgi:hypothetical protein